jgi:hypothetical protein
MCAATVAQFSSCRHAILWFAAAGFLWFAAAGFLWFAAAGLIRLLTLRARRVSDIKLQELQSKTSRIPKKTLEIGADGGGACQLPT